MDGEANNTGQEKNRPPSPLKTWGQNKSVRLQDFDYHEHAPYHVIVRCRPGAAPFGRTVMATMAAEALTTLLGELNAHLGAFCLMPDHLHVLLSPDQSGRSVGEIIGRYKGITTKRSWFLGWEGRLWQAPFYDHIVRRSESIVDVARYIYENPDRRGLSSEYPYRWVDAQVCARSQGHRGG